MVKESTTPFPGKKLIVMTLVWLDGPCLGKDLQGMIDAMIREKDWLGGSWRRVQRQKMDSCLQAGPPS